MGLPRQPSDPLAEDHLEGRDIRLVELDAEIAELTNGIHEAATQAPTVAIVGLGYVGLPTSLALVARGARVIGLDIDPNRIAAIESRDVDLVPADFARLDQALGTPDFNLTVDPSALSDADAIVVCVPTPVDEHLVPDLRILKAATKTVVAYAVAGQTIILTSTAHIGSTRELVVNPLEARGLTVGRDVFVAYSPERIDPGNVRYPQESVHRVVGGVTDECSRRAVEVISRVAPVTVVSSPEVAELTKLYENTFRAVNIALANELEDLSHDFGVDAQEVIEAASTKPFGFMPFFPGVGVGGHCIPCDPHYLLWQLRSRRMSAPVIDAAMSDIAMRPSRILARAVEMVAERGRSIVGSRVVVVGVAYKAGVQDVRESPALELLHGLRERGAIASYVDGQVPAVELADGSVLRSMTDPDPGEIDLVIVHVLQPGDDHRWLDGVELVLDPGAQVRRYGAGLVRIAPVA
jgi:nucleotide sugar dehydrogenase